MVCIEHDLQLDDQGVTEIDDLVEMDQDMLASLDLPTMPTKKFHAALYKLGNGSVQKPVQRRASATTEPATTTAAAQTAGGEVLPEVAKAMSLLHAAGLPAHIPLHQAAVLFLEALKRKKQMAAAERAKAATGGGMPPSEPAIVVMAAEGGRGV